jgi:hypothetical protein
MQRVWKRIALHGFLTALVLGLVGAMLAELASVWLASSAAPRAGAVEGTAPAADALPDTVRSRLPLAMAGLGFAAVAVGELLLFVVRGNKPPAPKKAAPAEPDPALLLLEELMTQADAALAKEKDANRKPPPDVQHDGHILNPNP